MELDPIKLTLEAEAAILQKEFKNRFYFLTIVFRFPFSFQFDNIGVDNGLCQVGVTPLSELVVSYFLHAYMRRSVALSLCLMSLQE